MTDDQLLATCEPGSRVYIIISDELTQRYSRRGPLSAIQVEPSCSTVGAAEPRAVGRTEGVPSDRPRRACRSCHALESVLPWDGTRARTLTSWRHNSCNLNRTPERRSQRRFLPASMIYRMRNTSSSGLKRPRPDTPTSSRAGRMLSMVMTSSLVLERGCVEAVSLPRRSRPGVSGTHRLL